LDSGNSTSIGLLVVADLQEKRRLTLAKFHPILSEVKSLDWREKYK